MPNGYFPKAAAGEALVDEAPLFLRGAAFYTWMTHAHLETRRRVQPVLGSWGPAQDPRRGSGDRNSGTAGHRPAVALAPASPGRTQTSSLELTCRKARTSFTNALLWGSHRTGQKKTHSDLGALRVARSPFHQGVKGWGVASSLGTELAVQTLPTDHTPRTITDTPPLQRGSELGRRGEGEIEEVSLQKCPDPWFSERAIRLHYDWSLRPSRHSRAKSTPRRSEEVAEGHSCRVSPAPGPVPEKWPRDNDEGGSRPCRGGALNRSTVTQRAKSASKPTHPRQPRRPTKHKSKTKACRFY